MHEALTDARRRNPAHSPRPAEEKVGLRSPPDRALTRLAARGDLSQLRWARWQSARSFDAHPPPRVRRGPWLYVALSQLRWASPADRKGAGRRQPTGERSIA